MSKGVSISYSRVFLKQLSHLSRNLIELAQQKEIVFKVNPFDPRLNTHKLHGKDKDAWAFSINRSHRIKFIFIDSLTVLFLEVGTHDIYS